MPGPYLHLKFLGETVLLSNVELHSWTGFLSASGIVVAICLSERLLTFLMDLHYMPFFLRRTRWRRAFCKASLYWLAIILRLLYMLVAMTFHLGLIFLIATSLATFQFFIDVWKDTDSSPLTEKESQYTPMQEPLLGGNSSQLRGSLARLRQKSGPNEPLLPSSGHECTEGVATEIEEAC